MGKNKLAKFADLETYPHVFQVPSYQVRGGMKFPLKGHWGSSFFKNDHPIVLELGCGKGEYTVGLAGLFPDKNFIGIDVKGARIWTGAKESLERQMKNVAFLRTDIEMVNHFFDSNEVSEVWITFPDPQMKKTSRRLTATNFMRLYQQFVKPGGLVHLKTDSHFFFTYTYEMAKANNYRVNVLTRDLYHSDYVDSVLSIQTYYEEQWISRNIPIKYLQFVLEPRETFTEPEVEIEKDTYRSYGRNQRSFGNQSKLSKEETSHLR